MHRLVVQWLQVDLVWENFLVLQRHQLGSLQRALILSCALSCRRDQGSFSLLLSVVSWQSSLFIASVPSSFKHLQRFLRQSCLEEFCSVFLCLLFLLVCGEQSCSVIAVSLLGFSSFHAHSAFQQVLAPACLVLLLCGFGE